MSLTPEQPLASGRAGTYFFEYEQIPLKIRVERIREHRDTLYAQLVFDCLAPGETFHIRDNTNLTSLRTKKDLVTRLTGFASSYNWEHIVEQVCEAVISKYHEGDPLIDLAEEEPSESLQWVVYPYLPLGVASVIFAPGGSLKSWFATRLAVQVSTGIDGAEPARVLVLDWDSGDRDWRQRLRMVARGMGFEQPPSVYYRRMGGTLANDSDVINEIIIEKGIGFVIIDHAAGATGEAESAAETNKFFDTLHAFNVTSLVIAHVTNDGEKKRPFGSAFWTNRARVTWELKRTKDTGDTTEIGLFMRKSNIGRIQPNRAYQVQFATAREDSYTPGDWVAFQDIDAASVPEFEPELGKRERILYWLKDNGPATVGDVAQGLEIASKEVSVYIRRLAEKGALIQFAANRWGVPPAGYADNSDNTVVTTVVDAFDNSNPHTPL